MPTRYASSPAQVTLTSNGAGTSASGTSAAFSPPAQTWLYIELSLNTGGTDAPTWTTPTNTGTALSWELVGSHDTPNPNGGATAVWRAYNANAQTGITVTAGASTVTLSASSPHGAMWTYVRTGCKVSQTGAAASGSATTTQTSNPAITTTAIRSRVAGVHFDWDNAGGILSSDTINAYLISGVGSGSSVQKAADSGAPGSVSINVAVDGDIVGSRLTLRLGDARSDYERVLPDLETAYAIEKAVVVGDAGELEPQRRVARERPRGVAHQQIDFPRLQGGGPMVASRAG